MESGLLTGKLVVYRDERSVLIPAGSASWRWQELDPSISGFRPFTIERTEGANVGGQPQGVFACAFIKDSGGDKKEFWVVKDLATPQQIQSAAQVHHAHVVSVHAYWPFDGAPARLWAAVLVKTTLTDPKTFLYLDQSWSAIDTDVKEKNRRLIDIKVSEHKKPVKYTAVAVENTGAAKKKTWCVAHKTWQEIAALSQANGNARVVHLHHEDTGVSGEGPFYAAILEDNPKGRAWWWLLEGTADEHNAYAKENNARIISISRVRKPGPQPPAQFAAVFFQYS
jgi:hypothetical protein